MKRGIRMKLGGEKPFLRGITNFSTRGSMEGREHKGGGLKSKKFRSQSTQQGGGEENSIGKELPWASNSPLSIKGEKRRTG